MRVAYMNLFQQINRNETAPLKSKRAVEKRKLSSLSKSCVTILVNV